MGFYSATILKHFGMVFELKSSNYQHLGADNYNLNETFHQYLSFKK
jgi:hypothetical protein